MSDSYDQLALENDERKLSSDGKPVEICERCQAVIQKGTKCKGNDQCCNGPDGGPAECCTGWVGMCCRCGYEYAIGQLP